MRPLLALAQDVLVAHRDLLGDLGHASVELVWPALAALPPERLAAVEDATRSQDLEPATWPLWWAHLAAARGDGGSAAASQAAPLLPGAAPQPGVARADYRREFERRAAEFEALRRESGARAREGFAAHAAARAARAAVVIAPVIGRRPPRGAPRPAAPRRPEAAPGARARLARKLGIAARAPAVQPARALPIPPLPPVVRAPPSRVALRIPTQPTPKAARPARPAPAALEEEDLFGG